MNKKIIKILIGVVFCSLFIACNSPFSNLQIDSVTITDISNQLDYNRVVQQGYMGGSVIYNSDNQSLGQLAEGVVVAFRLGKVNRFQIDENQDIFEDLPESAQVGTLLVNSITEDAIDMTVKLYNYDGKDFLQKDVLIKLGEGCDINEDGYNDFEYTKPILKRNGYGNARYLQFISSQENLYTTMFSIFPEQYENGKYPNGIIGVNPNGYFILEKYSNIETGARTAVSGVYKGDYVLDNIDGSYHRITTNKYSKSNRAIEDEDLEKLDCEFAESYYFSEEEFSDYSKTNLLSVLPSSVKQNVVDDLLEIEVLNNILNNRDLIQIIHSEQGSVISQEDYDDVLDELNILSDEDVIKINRLFLEHNYPDYCPKKVIDTNAFAEMMPLASVTFTAPDDVYEYIDLPENSSRAANETEYEQQRKAIEAKYKTFKEVCKIKVPIPFKKNDYYNVKLNNVFFAIGLKGDYNITFGNIYSTLDVCAYLNADTDIDVLGNINRDLVKKEIKENITMFQYGPIILNFEFGATCGIPFNVDLTHAQKMNGRFAFTGLYSGGFTANLKYGVTWKKWWLVKVPSLYCNTTATNRCDKNTTYLISSNTVWNKAYYGSQVSISPYVDFDVGINITQVIHGGFFMRQGFSGKVKVGISNSNLVGNAGVYYNNKLGMYVTVGIDKVPIINVPLNKRFEWPALEQTVPLQEWNLFNIKQ